MISRTMLLIILFCVLGINTVFVQAAQEEPESNASKTNASSSVWLDIFDWLGKNGITLIVAIIAAIAASWTFIQARWNGHYFQKLLLRELSEIEPDTSLKNIDPTKGFRQFMKRDFIHKEILDDPTQNKDYIFSINVNLLYLTNQLWSAFENDDLENFLKHFCYLTKGKSRFLHREFDKKNRLTKACTKWLKLVMKENVNYSEVISNNCEGYLNPKYLKDQFISYANNSQNSPKEL